MIAVLWLFIAYTIFWFVIVKKLLNKIEAEKFQNQIKEMQIEGIRERLKKKVKEEKEYQNELDEGY